MRTFRFSLAGLFGHVTFAALNFAALRYSVELWAASLLLLVIAVLLVGVLGILYRRDERRAFWSGLTLFGAAYMLLALAPGLDSTAGNYLITTKLFRQAHERTRPQKPITLDLGPSLVAFTPDGGNLLTTQPGKVWDAATGRLVATALAGPDWDDVRRGGHSLFALLCCVLGGLLARYFYLTRENAAPSK